MSAGQQKSAGYRQLWGIVEGSVADAFKNHPDYLTPRGQRSATVSIVKRVTGTILGFAEQSAQGRGNPAANEDRVSKPAPQASGGYASEAAGGALFRHPHSDPHCRIGKWKPKKPSRYRSAGMFPIKTAQLMREVAAGVHTVPQSRHWGGEGA